MDDDNQHADIALSFRVVPDQRDQWEVVNDRLGVCGRVRRDAHGRFSVTRDVWDGKWTGGFGSRREAAEHLYNVQREVETVRVEAGQGKSEDM